MKAKASPLLLVPFHEVRHDQPDDCLHYEEVERRGAEMHWQIPAHRHEGLHQFQLLVVGSLSATVDGRQFHAIAPVMLMVAPGSVHGFAYSHECTGHQVTIPSSTLRQLLSGSELVDTRLGESFVFRPTTDLQRVLCLFEQIQEEFSGGSEGRVHALLGLATLLAVEFARQRGEQFRLAHLGGARDTLVRRYLNLMERHYTEHRPLDFYAKSLDVTPDHLSRMCKKMARKSALQLHQERLFLEARRLLAYSPLPVSEVATQLGFEDAAYFTKSFRRAMGTTPTEYRKLIAKGVRSAGNP